MKNARERWTKQSTHPQSQHSGGFKGHHNWPGSFLVEISVCFYLLPLAELKSFASFTEWPLFLLFS